MVHALHEAWRILRPQGILIDLRPLCADAPLEIVFTGGCDSAGPVDMSLGIAHENAADHAVESAVGEGIFKELELEHFDFAFYWDTPKEMKAEMDEYWKDDAILSPDVLQRAAALFKKRRSQAQVRLRVPMKLAKFEKQA